MTNNLRETLFGFRSRRAAEALAAFKTMNAQPAFNEAGTTLARRRSPRIIGITEQRLRARNQPFWITDVSAWRKMFARLGMLGL
jgi:hypothetical protein